MRNFLLIGLCCFCALQVNAQRKKPVSIKQSEKEQKLFWKQLTDSLPEFDYVFKKNKKYRFEIIYGQIDHEPGQSPKIKKYYFGDGNTYFYPASCVKLPVALKTCQRLNDLTNKDGIVGGEWYLQFPDSAFCGGQKYKTKSTHYLKIKEPTRPLKAAAMCGTNAEEFCNLNQIDPDSDLKPGAFIKASDPNRAYTVNELLSEMLIYSNNDFYNQLFDFSTGEECEFNSRVKITTRFLYCLGDDTEKSIPSVLINNKTAETIKVPGERITDYKKNVFSGGYLVGKGVKSGDNIIKQPKNFAKHNAIKLETLQNMIIELVFPGYVHSGSFYDINNEQRRLLIRYLGMKPSEDKIVSDTGWVNAPDDLTNFLFTGQDHTTLPANIRIVNIVGQSYGFLTDCMYFADEKNKVDFFLAARIYVNQDEILNDDQYEYEEIAYPLFKKLGEKIYEYELKRPKTYQTNPGWLFEIFR